MSTDDAKTFNVTMLSVLREDFEYWLLSKGLVMAQVPDSEGYIVIPEIRFEGSVEKQ